MGEENIFIFGNTAEEVEELRRSGYKPREYYEQDEELHRALTQIGTGVFSPAEPGRYRDLLDSLINFGDHYGAGGLSQLCGLSGSRRRAVSTSGRVGL